jgi:hypothetical protein
MWRNYFGKGYGPPQDNLIIGIRFVGYTARNRTLNACPIVAEDT